MAPFLSLLLEGGSIKLMGAGAPTVVLCSLMQGWVEPLKVCVLHVWQHVETLYIFHLGSYSRESFSHRKANRPVCESTVSKVTLHCANKLGGGREAAIERVNTGLIMGTTAIQGQGI